MLSGVQEDLVCSLRRARKVWTHLMHEFERDEHCIDLIGSIHIWDLLFQQDDPALSIKVGPDRSLLFLYAVHC